MQTKRVYADAVKNSRGEKTIRVIVRTSKGKFKTSAPSGKSKGEKEVKPYKKSLEKDIEYINNICSNFIIEKFSDLKKVEKLVMGKIGGNTLFCLEASLLKALATEIGKELWEIINEKGSIINESKIKIKPVGNIIGGGLHSKGKQGIKPDFQEFLFIPKGGSFAEKIKTNNIAYKMAGKLLKSRQRNDEGAWETDKTNEGVLKIMEQVRNELKNKNMKIDIGLDIAASSFYRNRKYIYKNPKRSYESKKQINYIKMLIDRFNIFYIEDPLDENNFSGFRSLMKNNILIVGDDLTTTNPERLKKAIRMKSINAIIIKPNQIGSLLKVKKVIDIAKKAKIKTIISHRSGETKDDTIADLGVGFECDFIKAGVYGDIRKSKLNRLIQIENYISKNKK